MMVKLIDFGLARRIPAEDVGAATEMDSNPRMFLENDGENDGLGPDGLMTTPVGTPHFVAPEVLASLPYGKEVDLFACGVILYWLLSAKLPFEDHDPLRLIKRIKRVEFDFDSMAWDGVSQNAKDLVIGLLDRSPFSRLTASLTLSHAWFYDKSKGHFTALESNAPSDQIVIRKWTADPGLRDIDCGLPLQLSGAICSAGISDGLKCTDLTSPTTPAKTIGRNGFST